ncbi:ECF transporter S component [Oceanobacillus salinisoli]|uniref:ECF transporter S component n=1 Tax=Oceanobacillus salinisoli TaxID=2678611 RepID=UPI0012E1E0EB|nr:ECF transporter S component [Oceanobacillus salinisoli]
MNTYKLTLLALLATLAIVGRYVFQFLPNIQPVTAIIIICGFLLGPIEAVILALLVTFLSNMLMGMGVWTVWQVVAWGLIGLISGLLGRFQRHISAMKLVILAVFSGYLYGFVISLTTYQITGKFWPYYLAGLPFDTSHAIGNAIFMVIFYPIILHLVKKYSKNRFSIRNTN